MLRDLSIDIKVENLDGLKKLLQEAADQVEQLQETVRKIENFKPIVKTD